MKNLSVTMVFKRNQSGEGLWMDKMQTFLAQEDPMMAPVSLHVVFEQDLISIKGVIDPSSARTLMNISLEVEKITGKRLKITPSAVKKFNETMLSANSYGKKTSYSDED